MVILGLVLCYISDHNALKKLAIKNRFHEEYITIVYSMISFHRLSQYSHFRLSPFLSAGDDMLFTARCSSVQCTAYFKGKFEIEKKFIKQYQVIYHTKGITFTLGIPSYIQVQEPRLHGSPRGHGKMVQLQRFVTGPLVNLTLRFHQ